MIPPKGKSTGRKPKYKFGSLIPNDATSYISAPKSKRSSIASAALHYGDRHGMEFTSRVAGKEVRIYRTK